MLCARESQLFLEWMSERTFSQELLWREYCVASWIITSSNSCNIHSNPFHGSAASDPVKHRPAAVWQCSFNKGPRKGLEIVKRGAHPLEFLCKAAFFVFLKQFPMTRVSVLRFFIMWTFSGICNVSLGYYSSGFAPTCELCIPARPADLLFPEQLAVSLASRKSCPPSLLTWFASSSFLSPQVKRECFNQQASKVTLNNKLWALYIKLNISTQPKRCPEFHFTVLLHFIYLFTYLFACLLTVQQGM